MVLFIAGLAAYLVRDWIAGLGIVVLWGIWRLLFQEGEPPVIAMALSFQWVQVTAGLYYYGLTGREVEAMYASDYRPMVLIGLGCVVALLLGLLGGLKLVGSRLEKSGSQSFAFTWNLLFTAYIASIFINTFLHEIAWQVPLLTQGIIAIGYLRLGLLYLIFRRLTRPRIRRGWFLGILGFELVLGFSGYFAGFREPLVLAALALIECFDRRQPAHWMRLGAVTAVMVLFSVVWMSIRGTIRQEFTRESFAESRTERLETVGSLSSEWLQSETSSMLDDLDRLVERLWAIYYPALAVSRVPEALPHEDGALMSAAVKHLVTPRLLFPDKGVLASDSELVRKYTGIPVAGADQNTSIAFGYAAESYVDFGLPWMFIPCLAFGLLMGIAYRFSYHLIQHRELAIALVCVVFWLSLYLFERSWIKTLGLSGTLMIYVGGVVWLIDQYLRGKGRKRLRPAFRAQSPRKLADGQLRSASPSRF